VTTPSVTAAPDGPEGGVKEPLPHARQLFYRSGPRYLRLLRGGSSPSEFYIPCRGSRQSSRRANYSAVMDAALLLGRGAAGSPASNQVGRRRRDPIVLQDLGDRTSRHAVVEVPQRALDPAVAPGWIFRRHPHDKRRDSFMIPGRPGRFRPKVHFRAISSRCHRRIVSGVTIVATRRAVPAVSVAS
jgi:hypothetical protein